MEIDQKEQHPCKVRTRGFILNIKYKIAHLPRHKDPKMADFKLSRGFEVGIKFLLREFLKYLGNRS